MAKALARVTVVEQVYYQYEDVEPYSIRSGFTRHTEIQEQPYFRWCTATEDWKPLDFGWMDDKLGMFVLVNETEAIVTISESNNAVPVSKQIIQICFSDNKESFWQVMPGESFRGTPSDTDISIRCNVGKSKFTLHCIPK